MSLYTVYKPSRSCLLLILHILVSSHLWSAMIVECILWCRLVYIHAKKFDDIIYCILCMQVIVFTLSLYVVQCFMNTHFPIALCTKVCYYVFKKMNNSEISHHPVHPFPMVEINSILYPDLACDSTLCLQWSY